VSVSFSSFSPPKCSDAAGGGKPAFNCFFSRQVLPFVPKLMQLMHSSFHVLAMCCNLSLLLFMSAAMHSFFIQKEICGILKANIMRFWLVSSEWNL
jgi:hypothetical protein